MTLLLSVKVWSKKNEVKNDATKELEHEEENNKKQLAATKRTMKRFVRHKSARAQRHIKRPHTYTHTCE